MPKHAVNCQFNTILWVGIIIFMPKIFALESNDLKHQKYDFIDVAKETVSGRSKGQTTRIFTTADELDEEFWLKYLGVDFRHAIHLEVDNNNNVIPMKDKNPQRQPIKHITNQEKRTRFVRQPLPDNQQLTMESLYQDNKNQYPTEKPETFNVKPNSSSLEDIHQRHLINNFNNKNTSRHKQKLLIHNNKYKQDIIKAKPAKPLKAIHEPIVVNLPDIDNTEHQINVKHDPVVFQIPPVIYHQKADLYPVKNSNLQYFRQTNDLYTAGIPKLSLDNRNTDLYSVQNQHTPVNRQDHYTTDEISKLSGDNRSIEIYPNHVQNTPIDDQHHQHLIRYVTLPHLTLPNNNKEQQHEHPVPHTEYTAHPMKRSYPQQKYILSPKPPSVFPVESFVSQPDR